MNSNNQRQTYWQQLTQGGINAVLFWALNIIIVVAGIFALLGYQENTPYVLAFALIMQVCNVLFTYTSKENKALRNLPSLVLLVMATGLLSCQQLPRQSAERQATEEELFPAPRMKTDAQGWTGPVLVSAH